MATCLYLPPGAGAEWDPIASRFELGEGQSLRLLTVMGSLQGERLGYAVAAWRPDPVEAQGVLVSAPSNSRRAPQGGNLIWLSRGPDGEWAGTEPSFLRLLPLGKIGHAVSGMGDFDGDGVADLVIGAPYVGPDRDRFGAVAVVRAWSNSGNANVQILSTPLRLAHFGSSLAVVGDVNGDGLDDLLVGAPVAFRVFEQEGAAFLYLGTPRGLATESVWQAWGRKKGIRLGENVQAAGDVNGDGLADVLIAAPRWDAALPGHGEVRLYLGCAEGLQAEPAWVYRGERPYSRAGRGLWGACDINRDDMADIMVGLPGPSSRDRLPGVGEVHFFFGRPEGLRATPDVMWASPTPSDGFGVSVCVAGDMNGDGFPDLAVGSPLAPMVGEEHGILRIFPGSLTGFSTTPMLQITGGLPNSRYSFELSALGDLDGDGLTDLGVGSPGFPFVSGSNGRCDVIFGSRGLGARPIALEALREPAFVAQGPEATLAAALESRRDRSDHSDPNLAYGALGFWALLGVAAVAIGSLGFAWKAARVKLENMRHRLHDFVGSELCGLGHEDHRIRRVIDELRATIWTIKQESPTLCGLIGELTDWAWEFASGRNLRLQLDLPEEEVAGTRVDGRAAETAHAAVRIALANVVEHAHATSALLRLHVTATELLVEVEDNGMGNDSERLNGQRVQVAGSRGLTLRSRVEQLGGSFVLSTATGLGTRLSVRLPIHPAHQGKVRASAAGLLWPGRRRRDPDG